MNTEPNRDHSALDLDCAKLFYDRLPIRKTDTEMMLEHERTIEKLKARLSEAEKFMDRASEFEDGGVNLQRWSDLMEDIRAYRKEKENKI